MAFKLVSEFSPTGDQPTAIKQLVDGFSKTEKFMTLQGDTLSLLDISDPTRLRRISYAGLSMQ